MKIYFNLIERKFDQDVGLKTVRRIRSKKEFQIRINRYKNLGFRFKNSYSYF